MTKKVKKKEEAPVVEEAVVVVSETIEDTENNVEPQVEVVETDDTLEEFIIPAIDEVRVDDVDEVTVDETVLATESDKYTEEVIGDVEYGPTDRIVGVPDEDENCGDDASTEPVATVTLDMKEVALEALRCIENPDDRFIQDVCNILKITRLKKVTNDAPVKEKKRHHKWNSGTIWKW